MKNLIKRFTPFLTLIEREIGRTRRVIGQAILAPLITASLYIFTFGFVLGPSIKEIQGVPYISFVFPGVFAMNLIIAVFSATSFSIYFMKFQKTLEDFLTLPISYTELIVSMLTSGIFRGLAITLSLSLVALAFGVNSIYHPFLLLFYVILISSVFGLLGIIVGIWADNSFEKFGIATNFIITPLSFLGGAFYSVSMLPQSLQFLVYLNPIFYAVDGIRYSLTGYHDASLLLGLFVLLSMALIFLTITVQIFRTGWKLRS
jgi:ABC-2 type transport system permease protein